ncbi:hypothetical protein HaLaN_21528 [Haematococcus lacustris]|uniref:Uncharacterized protein n=1 Tax=Haematococcus lacustris TaxID=44745 RepID=A0A6A0A2U0_HAELA|nr:hypothetical protein HaLaN_21528 [Haematococcus lacustris]
MFVVQPDGSGISLTGMKLQATTLLQRPGTRLHNAASMLLGFTGNRALSLGRITSAYNPLLAYGAGYYYG